MIDMMCDLFVFFVCRSQWSLVCGV